MSQHQLARHQRAVCVVAIVIGATIGYGKLAGAWALRRIGGAFL